MLLHYIPVGGLVARHEVVSIGSPGNPITRAVRHKITDSGDIRLSSSNNVPTEIGVNGKQTKYTKNVAFLQIQVGFVLGVRHVFQDRVVLPTGYTCLV
jgi:hypothetical protein